MRTIFKLAATAAVALGLSAGASVAADPMKIGFIYVGPVSDHGWSYQHDQGRLALEKYFGEKVKTTYIESVPEGADAERAIERLARSGHELIFTTSFGYMNPTMKVAKKFPKVKFEHATGYKQAKNVSSYGARFYEGRYVLGQVAAKISKSGTAGYIGSFPIPEVVRGIMGFGQASDMIKFAPKSQATAIVDDWSAYYISRVQAVMDGTWKGGDTWGGLDMDMVHMAPFTNIPADVADAATKTLAAIKSGELKPFTGPVMKQDGSVFLKDGEVAEDGALLSMNFYVKGIDDQLPK
ncbi:BMP family ABC transporter substrate-binding protein [Pseudovibrio sp. Tun.PSC04-5.I4]|uniref:BMP family ABC transporter substrate-binding protein n=1 Tax=Pseudovibrio sp. Tun.PSC04-5.I4 TaxID=1798213 RepID=UPI000B833442|nr:BMP family ABC transporter substrate-binding protein [Pseudovibrio sp. Tun.PSC04-5.I4]